MKDLTVYELSVIISDDDFNLLGKGASYQKERQVLKAVFKLSADQVISSGFSIGNTNLYIEVIEGLKKQFKDFESVISFNRIEAITDEINNRLSIVKPKS